MKSLAIGLGQIKTLPGHLDHNLERHREAIREGREKGCDVIVFPELSLSGYGLMHGTPAAAMDPEDSPYMAELLHQGRSIDLIVGFAEKGPADRIYNAAAVIRDGRIVYTHRKLFLPTYGIFEEGRFFAPGSQLEVLSQMYGGLGVLICEDLWHGWAASVLAHRGCRVLAVLSASPSRVAAAAQPANWGTWDVLVRACAILNRCYVVYVNRVGWEEGVFFGGGSQVVDPEGEPVSPPLHLDEAVVSVTIDLEEVTRARYRTPLLRDERWDLVAEMAATLRAGA